MKKLTLLIVSGLVWLFAVVSTSCKSSSILVNPIPKSAVWESSDRNKIYDNSLTALHLQGFEIEPLQTNKQSGLIVTNKIKFNPVKGFDLLMAEYYLNLLVFETADGKPALNVNINGVRWYETDKAAWGYKKENVQNLVNNRISEDLNLLFRQLETTIGKPVKITTTTLTWD